MFVLNLLNSLIYNSLKNSNNEYIRILNDIYTFLPKNPIFPYIFLECKNIVICNNYNSNLYNINMSIKIYNKEVAAINSLNIVNAVQKTIENIKHENILDINIIEMKNNFNNGLFSYFESVIDINFLINGN